jgi:hypothetical protein
MRLFDRGRYVFRGGMIVTGIGVAHWKIQVANVDPLAIHICFLEPIEGGFSHAPAVTVGISTRTDNEIIRHVGYQLS